MNTTMTRTGELNRFPAVVATLPKRKKPHVVRINGDVDQSTRHFLRTHDFRWNPDSKVWEAIGRVEMHPVVQHFDRKGAVIVPAPAPGYDPIEWTKDYMRNHGVHRAAVREGEVWIILEQQEEPMPAMPTTKAVEKLLGRSQKKNWMWEKLNCKVIPEQGYVTGHHLSQDGWITERFAIGFLEDLVSLGVLQLRSIPANINGRNVLTYVPAPARKEVTAW